LKTVTSWQKIILNTKEISVQLLTLFLKVLYSRIPKRCLNVYYFWKNEFAAKKDQKPASGKNEIFGEKGSVSYRGLGEQDHGTRICGYFTVSRSMNY